MEDKEITLGKYAHYKTQQLYEVVGIALHSETHEEMVIYKALYNCEKFGENRVWVRPKKMFLEMINIEGKYVPRFSLIK